MAEKIGLEAVMDMAGFAKGMKQYTGGIDDMTDKTTKGSSIFSKLGGVLGGVAKVGIAAAVTGFGALTAVIVDSIGEAAKAQEVDAQLDAVLKATGGTAGMTKDEILGLANALSQVTPFEDDMIAATETVLLQFKNIGKDVFPQATEMALDLAQRLGIDTTSAAKLLGKALEEPGEGLARLKSAGIAFTDEQEAMIKKMVAAGDTAGAQKYIMDRLGESIGGAARAAGETFAGKMTILQNSIGNVKESIGTAFLPVLTQLADKFTSFVQENGPAIQAFFQGVADWATTKLVPALLEIWNWLQTNLPIAIQYLSNLWTTSLQPALTTLWNFIETNVLPVFAKVYSWLFTNLPIAIQAFTEFWDTKLAPALATVWNFISTSLIPALTDIWNWISVNIPPAIQTLSDFWNNTLLPALTDVWTFITTNVIPALTDIWNWIATNIPPAIQTLSDFWTNTLLPALTDVWDFISINVLPIFAKVAGWFSGEGTTSATGWVDVIKDKVGKIITFMSEEFGWIVDWVKENWPLIQKTVETVMEAVKKVIDTVLTIVKKIVEGALAAIKKFWEEHGESIKKIVGDFWEIIKKVIDTAIKTVGDIIKTIMLIIQGDWEGAWETIKGALERIWDTIKLVVQKGFDALKEFFKIGLAEIKKVWDGIADWAYGIGKSIVQGIKQGLIDMWDNLVRWIQKQIQEIKELIQELFNLGSPSKWAIEVGQQVTIGLGKGFEKGFKFPITAVLEGVQDVKGAMAKELGSGLMMGYNRQAMTPAYATSQNVNVSFGDTTINSGLDAELFQAQVLQTVTRAVRGY